MNLDLNALGLSNNLFGDKGNKPATEGKPEFTPAKYWMNIGYNVQVPNEETGEVESILLSPNGLGIALDNIKIDEKKYKSPRMAGMTAGKNQLVEYLQEVMTKLEPGQSVQIPLTVEVRRVDDSKAEAIDPADNPFAFKL